MTENAQPAEGAAGDAPGRPYYEKSRAELKALLQKRRVLERQLAQREESILHKESEYLESTPSGNIITGFDSYIKGTTSAAAQRKRTGLTEANRIFSRSSISYNPINQSEAQTPGSATSAPPSLAPTPLSTSFVKGDIGGGSGSNAATPTSATGPRSASGPRKKKTTAAAAAAAANEDSETDSKETKKVRTNFGAARK